MKKFLAICMILMLCVASASAAEWPEGCSPARPYQNSPEIDLETQMGYMMFYPNTQMGVAGGGRMLFIYLPREDVVAGPGLVHVRTEDRGEEWSVALNDTEHVNQRAMLEQEKINLMWGSGMCFEITLPTSLRLGTTYYIDLDTRCIEAGEKITNPAIKGDSQNGWKFATDSAIGVNEMCYRRAKADGSYETVLKPTAGDEIRFDLVVNEEVAMAVIYTEANAMFEVTNFTESCEVIGTVTGDDPIWSVLFLDAAGNPLAWVEF